MWRSGGDASARGDGAGTKPLVAVTMATTEPRAQVLVDQVLASVIIGCGPMNSRCCGVCLLAAVARQGLLLSWKSAKL